MALHYNGDLDADLIKVREVLKGIEDVVIYAVEGVGGFGRAQQIIRQIEDEPGRKFPESMRYISVLDALRQRLGRGESQAVLQVLWASNLKDQGLPLSGALGPK